MSETMARRRWMSLLAKARPEQIEQIWRGLDAPLAYHRLRGPEIGLAMVRGRIGGDGPPFNVGEMTVTRCSVRLASGAVGHAWIAGRRLMQAEQAAALDALLQQDGTALRTELDHLETEQRARREHDARQSAATKVDFFTMVRGEPATP